MGRNSKQRRDAKRRKVNRGAGRPSPDAFNVGGTGGFGPGDQPGMDPFAFADLLVVGEVQRIAELKLEDAALVRRAERLSRQAAPLPLIYLADALHGLLARLVATVVESGWSPEDLGELVRRRAGEAHLSFLVDLLTDDAARGPALSPAWRAQLDALGARRRVSLATVQGLAAGLGMAALLARLPTVPATIPRSGAGSAPVGSEQDHRKLATVRALLAKAESTPYDEEAEALSTKAQELISRYALERLLTQAPSPASDERTGVAARRIWLDAPYVAAKAILVNEVAMANLCRSVFMDRLGVCTIVGDPPQLDAVELLATSLLVQGSAAMVRHGSLVDRRGVSRTRSFRQAFLVSYSTRIGQRLREAAQGVVRDSGEERRLLPALRDYEARVDAAIDEMFPYLVQKQTAVTNELGWAAGWAAADLALLDVQGQVNEKVRSAG